MLSNTHHYLHVSRFDPTGHEIGKFIVERLPGRYILPQEAGEARRQLSAQRGIVLDHIDIRRCKADCV